MKGGDHGYEINKSDSDDQFSLSFYVQRELILSDKGISLHFFHLFLINM